MKYLLFVAIAATALIVNAAIMMVSNTNFESRTIMLETIYVMLEHSLIVLTDSSLELIAIHYNSSSCRKTAMETIRVKCGEFKETQHFLVPY